MKAETRAAEKSIGQIFETRSFISAIYAFAEITTDARLHFLWPFP